VKIAAVVLVRMLALLHQEPNRSNSLRIDTGHLSQCVKRTLYHLPQEGVMTQRMVSQDVRENLTNPFVCPKSPVKVKVKVRRKLELMEIQEEKMKV
jgi:hypothetical protein